MPSDPIDLSLHRFRSIDRKLSDLIDRLDDLVNHMTSLDAHVATLEKDRHRHEVMIAELRGEVARLTRRMELRDD